MRIPIVRDGDFTTTGGRVFAARGKCHDNGIKLALHSEYALCGKCGASWPIVGTGYRVKCEGIHVVLHGDCVLCPCGNYRVIAGDETRCFYHREPGDEASYENASSRQSTFSHTDAYDEQFAVLDSARKPIRGIRYRLILDGATIIEGTKNAEGKTKRIATDGVKRLKLQLEK